MSEPMRGRRPRPRLGTTESATAWDGRPWTLADVTELRLRLREGRARRASSADVDDDVETLRVSSRSRPPTRCDTAGRRWR